MDDKHKHLVTRAEILTPSAGSELDRDTVFQAMETFWAKRPACKLLDRRDGLELVDGHTPLFADRSGRAVRTAAATVSAVAA